MTFKLSNYWMQHDRNRLYEAHQVARSTTDELQITRWRQGTDIVYLWKGDGTQSLSKEVMKGLRHRRSERRVMDLKHGL